MFYRLFFALLLFPIYVFAGEPATTELKRKLDSKISYHSTGQAVAEQIKIFEKMTKIPVRVKDSAVEACEKVTKKFFYKNARSKYVLYRLIKEAGVKMMYDGDTIVIYKSI